MTAPLQLFGLQAGIEAAIGVAQAPKGRTMSSSSRTERKGRCPPRAQGCVRRGAPRAAYPRSSSASLRADRVIPLAALALALATPGLADGQGFRRALR